MYRRTPTTAVYLVAVAAGGCSNGTAAPPAELAVQKAGTDLAVAEYTLTAEEQALDCKKLTGRMQVRILQIRDYSQREKTSTVGRMLQSVASPILGGKSKSADQDARYQQDRAVLEAYNRQLAAKKCATFNLEAELRPASISSTPTPVKGAPKPAH